MVRDRALARLQAGSLAVTDALRGIGYPAPATEVAVQIGRDVVVVRELLPGMKIDRLDADLLEQALALTDLQAGALAGLRDDLVPVSLFLREDGPGFCLHEPLWQHNSRTPALERRILAAADDYPDCFSGDDALHLDFHPATCSPSTA